MKSLKVCCTLVVCLFLSLGAVAQQKKTQEQPNFLFIITDDMRWDAMGIVQREQGEKARFPWFKTPNLDRLANESIRFKNAMVATSVCSPSRAEYLTGRYSHFNGVATNRTHFPLDNVTYATELKNGGYTTAYIGKWHMGNQKERPGFDYYASFADQGRYEDWFFLIDGVKTKTTGWVDDVSTDFAIDFIKREHKKPFVLSLGFKTPHVPFIPPARAKNRFAGEKIGPVANFNHDAIYRKGMNDGMVDLPRVDQPLWALNYFQCISAIDDNIGRLMATLEEQGLMENTVVIFTSDNGYYVGEHALGDFMGDKRSAYEEGLRVPMLVRFPSKEPHIVPKGNISEALVLNIDLAPTLLDLAGLNIPREMQGKSWAPLLNDPSKEFRNEFFYEYFFENKFAETPTVLALRTKTHKLIKYPDHQGWTELYDIANDPFETKNLVYSPEHKNLLAKMEAAFEKEKNAVGYLFPDYAQKPWPADYVHVKRPQNYPWLKQNNPILQRKK